MVLKNLQKLIEESEVKFMENNGMDRRFFSIYDPSSYFHEERDVTRTRAITDRVHHGILQKVSRLIHDRTVMKTLGNDAHHPMRKNDRNFAT
jgi:hypothetical protein